MDNYTRMKSGKIYAAMDEELSQGRHRARQLVRQFNDSDSEDIEQRVLILKTLFKNTGERVYIEPPFRCDYGTLVEVGENFYANYELIILDCAPIKIGHDVMFGPRVSLYAASHPLDAEVRKTGLETSEGITIGDNVWLGGNVVVTPGVKIGDNTVVGAGSVVTKDLPSNVIAVGNPCRVLRELTNEDKEYWENERQQYNREEETNF